MHTLRLLMPLRCYWWLSLEGRTKWGTEGARFRGLKIVPFTEGSPVAALNTTFLLRASQGHY